MNSIITLKEIPEKSEVYFRENYHLGSNISSNPKFCLCKATHLATGEKRVARIVAKASRNFFMFEQRIRTEISILLTLDHPNTISIREYFQDVRHVYLIVQRIRGPSIYHRLLKDGLHSEADCAAYMQQILSILKYLHSKRIAYRDLKLENLVFSSTTNLRELKLVNYNLARMLDHNETMSEKIGSPYYLAPEVLNGHYTEKCDLWSAGVLLYVMLSGNSPFRGKTEKQINEKILNGAFEFGGPIWSEISDAAKNLITCLLCVNPNERILIDDALRHPWLSTVVPRIPSREISAQYMVNLSSFHSAQELKKVFLKYIFNFFLTNEDRDELFELFNFFDQDKNGLISRDELKEGFYRLFGTRIKRIESEIDRIIDQCDLDKSGELSYSEFVAAAMDKQKLFAKARMEAVFNSIDKNSNGYLEADELRESLHLCSLGQDTDWEQLIRECDLNGDGKIDMKEFITLMLKN